MGQGAALPRESAGNDGHGTSWSSPWMGVSISGALNQALRIATAAGVMLAPAPAFSKSEAKRS